MVCSTEPIDDSREQCPFVTKVNPVSEDADHRSTPEAGPQGSKAPPYKQVLLALGFAISFLILDGSSTASKQWEGAPPWYLPAGLSMALLLGSSRWSVPLVLTCSLIAGSVNYHRPMFSWCGIPGCVGIYLGYIAGAKVLKRCWPCDLRRGTLRDVMRYLLVCFGGSIVSALAGILTLWADGMIRTSEILRTTAEWWISDALALVAFGPFLVIYVSPLVNRWCEDSNHLPRGKWINSASPVEIIEASAQAGLVALAIWFAFAYPPAVSYQPRYLLFIPLMWVAVRRGLPGAVLTTFSIGVGMMIAAWVSRSHFDALPPLQLATLVLGLTGLALGAVVTERHRGEQCLRESESRYRLLFERNLAGVFRTTLSGRILECNPAAAKLFGYESPEQVLGIRTIDLYDEAIDRGVFLARLKREKVITNYEIRFRRKNGDPVWTMLNASLVESKPPLEDTIEGTLVDMTERKLAEERVQSLAYYDALTNLPNRMLLSDRLSQALATARRQTDKVAVLFVDLDRFKTINDSLGHNIGDLLLQEVSLRLKACTRAQDTIARIGGDEFLIVLTAVKDIQGASIAERFMDAILQEFTIEGHSLCIGCSIGISMFPDHGNDAETLIKHADAAMYSAKENGRNNFQCFADGMSEQSLERLQLESALRLAMGKKELFLMYQPQISVASGDIIGMEALLRWRHPELGLVPPDRFIRIAEMSGIILPIGEWVIRTACFQARKWHDEGLPAVPVAVNVSAVQFRHEGFCRQVRAVLDEAGLAANRLEMQLTESVLLANEDHMLAILRELKAMGVGLAIDDFGTGYSNLSYLKRFPVSKLKIDRSFIRDVAIDSDDAAITTAIINMAKSLNLSVIAEGVENEGQMSFLRKHQCSGIQGYYFSKPLLPEDITRKLFQGRAAKAGV